jgi:hypothetical protein
MISKSPENPRRRVIQPSSRQSCNPGVGGEGPRPAPLAPRLGAMRLCCFVLLLLRPLYRGAKAAKRKAGFGIWGKACKAAQSSRGHGSHTRSRL